MMDLEMEYRSHSRRAFIECKSKAKLKKKGLHLFKAKILKWLEFVYTEQYRNKEQN